MKIWDLVLKVNLHGGRCLQEPGRERDYGKWVLGKRIRNSGDHALTGGACPMLIHFHLHWAGQTSTFSDSRLLTLKSSRGNNLVGESKT